MFNGSGCTSFWLSLLIYMRDCVYVPWHGLPAFHQAWLLAFDQALPQKPGHSARVHMCWFSADFQPCKFPPFFGGGGFRDVYTYVGYLTYPHQLLLGPQFIWRFASVSPSLWGRRVSYDRPKFIITPVYVPRESVYCCDTEVPQSSSVKWWYVYLMPGKLDMFGRWKICIGRILGSL